MLLVAILTIERTQLAAFRAYEMTAARIMARHGGKIERAVVLEGEPLRELHLVRFPDDDAFARYRADAELQALRAERDRCVLATEILPAHDGPQY